MNKWLYDNLPGKPSHTPDRWKKLNDEFGEGWEANFGKEAKWDARLVEVRAWVVENGHYPRAGATDEERSMYMWLYLNLPGKKNGSYTPDRWKKLNEAFGEGWEKDFGSRKRRREALVEEETM